MSFTDCVDEDSWDEDNLHTACSRNFLFPRSPSSLAFRLFIVFNLDSFLKIFFKRDQNQKTDDLWYTRKLKKIYNTNKRRSALLRIFSTSVKHLLRILGYMWKRSHKLQHSQRTVTLTNLVTGLPTPFSAVHLYSPSSWLPRMVKGKFTRLLSATFVQVIIGVGLPSAKQNKLTTPPLFTICSPEMFVILDASLKGKN